MENSYLLKVKDLNKHFGDLHVLKGIDFKINKGEIISIIGPSGSGKSTLLRSLNFLESVESGQMEVHGDRYDMASINERSKQFLRQHFTMVFQQYHLFQNKTALENITEGLIITKKMSLKEAEKVGLAYLKKVNLLEKKNSYPYQLSGGQQQRVGIARALAMEPDIILLDEPTSALDPELVGEVLKVIRNLATEDITMVIVTHEMAFAREISDRILFMDEGMIIADERPERLFKNQENQRIKNFIDSMPS
jgi:ABC-type polar amino acid transport system ATPase subunit